MSDNMIRLIPTDPTFVPDDSQARAVVALLATIAPQADRIDFVDEGTVVFVDAGENFESISCGSCGADIDFDWWGEEMGAASANDFSNLATTAPCCGATTTLNDLVYSWPQGFARWRVEVTNPGVGQLDSETEQALSLALGHPIRLIYSHV